jgi:hypothetical protein
MKRHFTFPSDDTYMYVKVALDLADCFGRVFAKVMRPPGQWNCYYCTCGQMTAF